MNMQSPMNNCSIRSVTAGQLAAVAQECLDQQMRFLMAWHEWEGQQCVVRYLLSQKDNPEFVLLELRGTDTIPSLAALVPLLGWYEREMQDLGGLHFTGHPEPFPLIIHEGFSISQPPLGINGRSGHLSGLYQPPTMPEVQGDQVQDLYWGPVRADVVETAEFHYSYIGEAILHYHPRLFFKHRGMEARFAGQDAQRSVYLAERVSGVGSACHALAYCQAVENAWGIEVPPRAQLLRVIIVELERLYNHFHYFGQLSKTTTLKVGAATGFLMEEKVKQLAGELTGSRYLRSLLRVGGLRRDLQAEHLAHALEPIIDEGEAYLDRLQQTATHLDRLMGTGVLSQSAAFDQGATGPVARASGLDRDLRRDHPYAAYHKLRFNVPVRQKGDAMARSDVRGEALREAIALLVQASGRLKAGPVHAEFDVPGGAQQGLGWAETPRGTLIYAVRIEDGRLQRVKIKSPSFSNWRVFPLTVHGTNMMDYAINEASFGLTIAGCDR
ncbi:MULTISPECIES: nickel-dependent hydrogenase large subunit [Acidithiobacillus]|uniref:NADH-quinone oxidoreductase subunit D n=1 Tax=Acidithiobacillus thiooxidans TaxID=930 RepID=A0A1C2IIR5_ACITH|nr:MULTISPECIES: nickel-dependent hydrogenase large subunit [Acidithiobacillus]OCX74060.1 NADH-quinone oxidoreductase subunit D [Acidithiobacillus thiooxidans]OCX75887.1 NADH-quinone oxidoreductase subunit D [Acidithiobacillus thiooxidans]OCX76058.1 NADH-quinone oxidoreductase subunit D [Acidithiobacillus thiooxidans]OCX79430.1 NADH-quinone oxidoreductase subunit D [Acidithiobacillus thiooxidans]OCX80312.1 NADH-quinone oxidoreductase subunit D [Acidithiobacillus thiooxidans]